VLRGGDDQAGFSVEVDLVRRLGIIRLWGFWSDMSLAQGIEVASIEAYKALQATGAPWVLLLDNRRFPAQRPEVQASMAGNMRDALALGLHRAASVVESSVTKLQLRRLGNQNALPPEQYALFDNEPEALRWLLGR